MMGLPMESTAEVIAAIVRNALPTIEAIDAPRQIPKGFSSQSWHVATSAGDLVVKLRRQMTDHAKLQSQVEAARLAWEAGIPTAEVLYADLSPVVGDRPVVILRYVPGVDAEEALSGLTNAQRGQCFADFGTTIGRMHRIVLPHFTERIGSPESAVANWATLVQRTADRYAACNKQIGALTSTEIAAIHARIIAGSAAVSDHVGPALTHRDLYLANVLLDAGRFAALIDFELAKGYDPLLDFIKLGMFVFAHYPDGLQPFMRAYRAKSEPPILAAERLAVCFALEQFVQVPNWAQTNQAELLRYSCGRLRDWLEGTDPWWLREIAASLA